MQYRREIDGLRAIAVLPVILFHAGFSVFSGGFVGVDVFFVISGYLITSILIADLEAGSFSILRFYERRARRILPALFVMMAVCIPFAWTLMLPNRFEDFSQSLAAMVFFGSNILFWSESGYFAPSANEKPLLHTWSLSVEEQYYLLFPLVLLLLWRFGRNRVFWVVTVTAAISLLISEWGWRYAPNANFFLSPPRAWELLAGSICAFLSTGREQRSNNILSALGLALIIGSIIFFDERTPFPSVYTLIPVGGAALVVLFAGAGTRVAQVLSSAGFVGIGLISYSAYLWHQPVFFFSRMLGLPTRDGLVMGGLSVASLLLAWASWRFVEQPFRRRHQPLLPRRAQVFGVSAGVGLFFLSIGLAGHYADGFDYRLNPQEKAVLKYTSYPFNEFYQAERCMLMWHQGHEDFDESCLKSARNILIGDSHAAAFSAGIAPEHSIGLLAQVSCPPVLDFPVVGLPTCKAVNDFRIGAIANSGAERVYVHADWFQYWYKPDFKDQFRKTLVRISQTGSAITIIGGVPKFYPNLPELVLRKRVPLVAGSLVEAELDDLRVINEELRLVALEHKADYWDPIDALCTDNSCLAIVASQASDFKPLDVALIAFDHGHLTRSGAAYVSDLFFADQ